MRATESILEAKRQIEICNACRYCESYCAVFPAMTLQRSFNAGDMAYLANLCHDCKGCFQACQHAPPHQFQINLPQAFAQARRETYAEYAWPRFMGGAFERWGTVLCIVTALAIALVLGGAMAFRAPGALYAAHVGPGAFYKVFPWGLMTAIAGATFCFSLVALAMGVRAFWRDTRSSLSGPITLRALTRALHDAATLRYLGNDGKGCNDFDDNFSNMRRRFHHALAYGFLFCFAATCVATIYDHALHLEAPYAFLSLPVLLGTIGGIGVIIGAAGLVWIKIVTDPIPVARDVVGGEYAMLALLLLVSVTGLVLLAARETSAMGVLLAIHLGFVLALFLLIPYGKMAHAAYRSAALLKAAIERERNKPVGGD